MQYYKRLEEQKIKTFDEHILQPIWFGQTVYRETFAMVVDDTTNCSAPFLYHPSHILKVESYDGRTIYKEGTDYCLKDDCLIALPSGKIPVCNNNRLYYKTREDAENELRCMKHDIGFGPVSTTDGRFISLQAIDNPSYLTDFQVAVTYQTTETWTDFYQESQLIHFPRLAEKLKNHDAIRIALYGDSISCGYDCSGFYHTAPYQLIWPELVMCHFEKAGIPCFLANGSKAGADTDWAISHFSDQLPPSEPDLLILAWGMNDRCPGNEYYIKIQQLLTVAHTYYPHAEILLIATTLPHPLTATPPIYFTAFQHEYAKQLHALCGLGIGIADVQSVQKAVMKKKRFVDISGNWLNHPNDYLARIQAQTVCAALPVPLI